MRGALFPLILLSACSSSDAELAALKSAHSIVAEWATVARLAAAGRVNATYGSGMAMDARSQLASERAAFRDPGDPAARLIDGLGETPDAAQLTAAAAALGRLEATRESR
jgi:hypothetical protein